MFFVNYLKKNSGVITLLLSTFLVGCSSGEFADLDAYVSEVRAKPAGVIKPIPPFKAAQTFNYSASGLRSPFDKPVQIADITLLGRAANVKPDPNRAKEFLEQYSIDSLNMVGTLQMGSTLWALMQDDKSGVHRVKLGNYLGRNDGKIIELTETYVAVVEIVANGSDGWVERPRTLKLKTLQSE
jgi:type IV pilus assembly protein PilP